MSAVLRRTTLSAAVANTAAGRRQTLLEKEELGQRGKRAEKSVKDLFTKLNTRFARFSFERLPDARSSGGRIKAQICDYMVWYHDGVEAACIPLEVKSIEHDYRLPKANLEQLPRLSKVRLCGAHPYVLVHFKTLDMWRIATSSYFQYGVPSWDMRDRELYPTAQAALESTGRFPILKD